MRTKYFHGPPYLQNVLTFNHLQLSLEEKIKDYNFVNILMQQIVNSRKIIMGLMMHKNRQ